MRRSAWSRAFAGLWSLWLAVVLSGPAALHSCPQHDGDAHAAMAHASHAGHGAHAADATDHSRHSTAPCTCVGLCCCVTTAALFDGPVAGVDEPAVVVADATHPDAPAFASERPHTLPFAHAPPRPRSLTIG